MPLGAAGWVEGDRLPLATSGWLLVCRHKQGQAYLSLVSVKASSGHHSRHQLDVSWSLEMQNIRKRPDGLRLIICHSLAVSLRSPVLERTCFKGRKPGLEPGHLTSLRLPKVPVTCSTVILPCNCPFSRPCNHAWKHRRKTWECSVCSCASESLQQQQLACRGNNKHV